MTGPELNIVFVVMLELDSQAVSSAWNSKALSFINISSPISWACHLHAHRQITEQTTLTINCWSTLHNEHMT